MAIAVGCSWRSSEKIVSFMHEIYTLLKKPDQIRRVLDSGFTGPEVQQVAPGLKPKGKYCAGVGKSGPFRQRDFQFARRTIRHKSYYRKASSGDPQTKWPTPSFNHTTPCRYRGVSVEHGNASGGLFSRSGELLDLFELITLRLSLYSGRFQRLFQASKRRRSCD
jgi:hypothetical protein